MSEDYPKEFVEFVRKIQAKNPLNTKLKKLPQYQRWFKGAFIRPQMVLEDYIMPLTEFFRLQESFVLDNGCGSGCSTVALSSQGAVVVGLESRREAIEVAKVRVKYHEGNPDFVLGDARQLPFRDGVFDLCVCIAVLEHIDEGRERCLRESLRVIRKHGVFAISGTPNRIMPKDFHTTELWFLPYMPRKLARRYALFRGRIIQEMNLERGMSYSKILKALSGSRIKVINKGDMKLLVETVLARIYLPTCMRVASTAVFAKFLGKFCGVLRIPTNALMPALTLYMEKC